MVVATSGGRQYGKRCPICGNETASEPGLFGDRYCDACGSLAEWTFGPILDQLGIAHDHATLDVETFISDLSGDSLDVVEMVMGYEDRFDITIPDSDYEKLKTVDDVLRYLRARGIKRPGE